VPINPRRLSPQRIAVSRLFATVGIPPSFAEKSDVLFAPYDQHEPVFRLSYMEIVSGINRLLSRGIPKEVIAQVLSQTIEALAKEADGTPRNQQQ
jgi:hypothetical protein